MKLKLDECENILQNEIIWCLDHPNPDLTEQEQLGFMNGLRQAQIIIRNAEIALFEIEKIGEIKMDDDELLVHAKALQSSIEMVNSLKEALSLAKEALERAPEGHTAFCMRMGGGVCGCWQSRRTQALDSIRKLEA